MVDSLSERTLKIEEKLKVRKPLVLVFYCGRDGPCPSNGWCFTYDSICKFLEGKAVKRGDESL